MAKKYDIAVLGVTSEVGEALLELLVERKFPVGTLYPLASSWGAGETLDFRGKELPILDVDGFDFSRVQLAFFAADEAVAATYAPKAAAAGCIVIDHSEHFRYEPDVPLVIPEVNPGALSQCRERNIVASPDGVVIQMLTALKPIYDAVGITRINVATYQAVAASGRSAVEELAQQTRALFSQQETEAEIYPKRIAFNVLPQIGAFQDNGYTREEMKLVWETRKILEDETIAINPTAVRVPVFHGDAAAVHIETRDKIGADAALALLQAAPGVVVLDEREPGGYPTSLDAVGEEAVYVGRIREDISHSHGLDLWLVQDYLRKGSALNGVQIAEILIAEYLD